MKISPTDTFHPAAASGSDGLLVFLDEAGALARWVLVEGGAVAAEGEGRETLPLPAGRIALAVPGEQVTLRWLDLAGDLAPAQAAGAARLMLADASADPLAEMHVAVGRAEAGLAVVALVPTARMRSWIAAAEAAGLDPDPILPTPLLIAPADSGFVRRDRGALADYRGPAAAFTLEPELAGAIIGDAPVAALDSARFETGLPGILAAPPLNLRQGPFARRRHWRIERPRLRRLVLLALALAALSLAVQVATILAYTFAADRMEAEASALAAAAGPEQATGPGFGAVAAVLFEAVRATPNVELTRIDYRADGSLTATVLLDNPATFAALRSRIEASGLRVEPGEQRSAGGRPAADLTVRPS